MAKQKIAVLLSGGVDSAVALRLLHQQGQDLTAFYLKIWLEDELEFLGECPWEDDLKYARQICEQIGVPLEVVNLQKEYFDTVVKYTIDEVKAGRTPNPDIMCNNHIKFGLFVDKMKDRGFEKIASGHYAQIAEKDGALILKSAPDPIKDQTYFLSRLSADQLGRIVFPIGHLKKSEVRDLAKKFDLPNQDRKDSQGICFLGKVKFQEFVNHYLGEKPGDIVEYESGDLLGRHQGFWYYTIGQRRDIRLGGGPWYVVSKDIAKNIVYVSKNYHESDKSRDTVHATDFNWFCGHQPKTSELKVKLRHGPQLYNSKVEFPSADHAIIHLDQDDQGIAPGQFAVFYDGDGYCFGSGVIFIPA